MNVNAEMTKLDRESVEGSGATNVHRERCWIAWDRRRIATSHA